MPGASLFLVSINSGHSVSSIGYCFFMCNLLVLDLSVVMVKFI